MQQKMTSTFHSRRIAFSFSFIILILSSPIIGAEEYTELECNTSTKVLSQGKGYNSNGWVIRRPTPTERKINPGLETRDSMWEHPEFFPPFEDPEPSKRMRLWCEQIAKTIKIPEYIHANAKYDCEQNAEEDVARVGCGGIYSSIISSCPHQSCEKIVNFGACQFVDKEVTLKEVRMVNLDQERGTDSDWLADLFVPECLFDVTVWYEASSTVTCQENQNHCE